MIVIHSIVGCGFREREEGGRGDEKRGVKEDYFCHSDGEGLLEKKEKV